VLALDQLGLDQRNAICHRIALDLTGKAVLAGVESPAKESATSDTGEITWRLPAKDQGVFEIRSPKTKGFIGHVDGQTVDLGDGVKADVGKTRTGWCTLMLTLLEGESFAKKPRRALIVATGYTENTDMGWKDETKSTVGTNWGKPPSLVEPVAATLRLPRGSASPLLYPLDERGQRCGGAQVVAAGDRDVQVKIGPPSGTVWYELEWK
jgi:hypothetical protein